VAITTSVRHQLLLLVLLPLVIVLPLLLVLVFYWGNAAYDRLLIYKINAELVIAHQYLERVLDANQRALVALAESSRLADVLGRPAAVRERLAESARRNHFDFLHLLDARGTLVASNGNAPAGESNTQWPVVTRALEGARGVALDILSADELATLNPTLRERAYLRVVPTANAAPDEKKEEARGMIIHAAAPVFDRGGRLVAVVEGGVLLNRNLEFVDNINDIVYTESALPLGSRGTVTLFLDDTRIATNVRMFADDSRAVGDGRGPHADDRTRGERALGTRVSLAVRDKVLGEGKVWLDTAFVVNDWYVSGYEPLHDSFGRRIGMLYVGFLEAPFAAVKQNILLSIVGLFAVITLAASVFGLRRARAIFRPLERMDATMDAVVGDHPGARVGAVTGGGEIVRLAQHFDRLLDTLQARSDELHQLNAELDRKVIERTRALVKANDDLRDAQAQLVRSERLAAIGQLTAGVAHEINNPIAVMQGNLDLVRAELGPALDPVAYEMRLLDEQIHRIRLIVTKLLQFARPDEFAGYVETVDVNAAVGDCLVLVRHELKKTSVEVRQDLRASRSVRINRGELQQVLINLMVNALQAMPEGGVLSLGTSDWDERGVRIDVADSGAGIAAGNLPRIFDPFYTTKKTHGTGLGLSISLALVERYGGTIIADSETGGPRRGSTFSVRLLSEPPFDEPGAAAVWGAEGT
jgi:two-component system NtrC family sensor kinase